MQPLPFRKEVQDFIRSAETLLSPALLNSPFTEDEALIIADYVMNLSQAKHPWSKKLVFKYAS
jgi:hypothetical protein